MKNVLLVLFISWTIFACASRKVKKDNLENRRVEIYGSSVDSVEYELIVFDVGFESWYLLQPAARDRTKSFYESKNYQAVITWNHIYHTALSSIVNSYIDYSPGVDYGFELNRKLYYYFVYFQQETGVRLW